MKYILSVLLVAVTVIMSILIDILLKDKKEFLFSEALSKYADEIRAMQLSKPIELEQVERVYRKR